MSKQWFEIDASNGTIRGWARSSGDELPVPGSGISIIEASDEQISLYESFVAEMMGEGLSPVVNLKDGALSKAADSRLRVTVDADKTIATVGESISLTVTAIDAEGAVRSGFNDTIYYPLPDGRVFAFQFVAGVASRSISVTKSGRYRLQSTNEIALTAALDLLAVE